MIFVLTKNRKYYWCLHVEMGFAIKTGKPVVEFVSKPDQSLTSLAFEEVEFLTDVANVGDLPSQWLLDN